MDLSFGDPVTDNLAMESDPRRDGFFVRWSFSQDHAFNQVRRAVLTDKKGNFWTIKDQQLETQEVSLRDRPHWARIFLTVGKEGAIQERCVCWFDCSGEAAAGLLQTLDEEPETVFHAVPPDGFSGELDVEGTFDSGEVQHGMGYGDLLEIGPYWDWKVISDPSPTKDDER